MSKTPFCKRKFVNLKGMGMMFFKYLTSTLQTLYGNFPQKYYRSDDLIILKDKENIVVYHRKLNSPVWIDDEALDYIIHTDVIDPYSNLSNNKNNITYPTEEFLAHLINNFIYLPEKVTADLLIANGVKNHLFSIQQGEYTTMLDLRISTACNFGCSHCIAGNAQTNCFMSFEQAKMIVDCYVNFLSKHSSRIIDIHFGIAEPFLIPGLIEQVVLYIESTYPNFIYNFSVNTNLSLLEEKRITFLHNHNIHLHTSIDGLKKTNDMIRTYKDGTGTYNDIINKISLLKKNGYPISDIGVTLTKNNYHAFKNELDEFINWCAEEGITEVACEFDLRDLVSVSTNEKVQFLLSFLDKATERGIAFDGTWGIPYRNIVNATYADSAYGFCRGSSGINLSVNPDGDVFLCSCSSKKICSIYSFEESVQPGGLFYTFVESNLLPKQNCNRDCPILGGCVGQCKVTKEYHPMADSKIEEQCEFYIAITHALLLRDAATIRKEVRS